MKKFVTFSLFFLVLLSSYQPTEAQHLEVGAGLGATNTRTDIANLVPANTRGGGNLFIRWNFNAYWVARIDYKYMLIYASDKNNNYPLANSRKGTAAELEFSNQLHEITANMEYNFLNYRSSDKKVRFSPFITGGVGMFRLFNEYEYGSGTGRFEIAVPFGLGIKYVLSKNWNLGLIFSSTKTFMDALDNVNGKYPRLSYYTPHSKGWDQATNDWYYFLGVNVSYTYYHIPCPDFYDF